MSSRIFMFSCSYSLLGFLCSPKFCMHLRLTPYIIFMVNSLEVKQLKSVIISRSSWKVVIFSSDSSPRSIASLSAISISSSSSWACCSSAAFLFASKASYCSIFILIKVYLRSFSVS